MKNKTLNGIRSFINQIKKMNTKLKSNAKEQHSYKRDMTKREAILVILGDNYQVVL